MKKKLSVLLSLLILALAFSSNAFAEGDPLSDALGNAKFSQLFNFLEQQGFSVDSDQIMVTIINNSPFSNEKNTPVNMTVTLVPFVKSTGESARIAFWNGTWGTHESAGALATIGEHNIYIYDGKNVRALNSSKDLGRLMSVPLPVDVKNPAATTSPFGIVTRARTCVSNPSPMACHAFPSQRATW